MGKCERGECDTPSACRAHNECLARDRKETVAYVVQDFDAMATECGGLEAATILAMTARLSAAHAREVEASTERHITIVRDYIKARDEYEAATRPLNSHAQPRVLPHSDPRVLSYRNARAALNETFKVSE